MNRTGHSTAGIDISYIESLSQMKDFLTDD